MRNSFLCVLLFISTLVKAQEENVLGGIIQNSKGDNVKFICENNDVQLTQYCKVAVSIELAGVKSYISNERIKKVYHDHYIADSARDISTRELGVVLYNRNDIIRNRKLGQWYSDYSRKIVDSFSNPLGGLNEPGAWLVYPALPFLIPLTAAVMTAEGIVAPIYFSIRDGITMLGQPSNERGFKHKKLTSILKFLSSNINQVKELSDRHFNRFIYLLSKMNY